MWASKGNEVFARKSARKINTFNIFIKKITAIYQKNDYDGYFYIYRSE